MKQDLASAVVALVAAVALVAGSAFATMDLQKEFLHEVSRAPR